jgi:hypothetical protein
VWDTAYGGGSAKEGTVSTYVGGVRGVRILSNN